MTTHSVPRRARIAFAIGLSVAVLAGGGTVSATPEEISRCTTTVCATAGVRVAITCSRPDVRTVTCQGSATLWGTGKANTTTNPGTLEWRGEGRCGGSCNSNQLAHGATAWNGITSDRGSQTKLLLFPEARRSSATTICITYSLYASSISTARGLSPISLDLDDVQASNADSISTTACNQL